MTTASLWVILSRGNLSGSGGQSGTKNGNENTVSVQFISCITPYSKVIIEIIIVLAIRHTAFERINENYFLRKFLATVYIQ